MKRGVFDKLVATAKKYQIKDDPSHEFNHVERVLNNAILIGNKEHADLDILIPAALFHDIVIYKKNDPLSKFEHRESAKFAAKILSNLGFTKVRIGKVVYAIENCSFTKGTIPVTLEAKILQDADMLESTGAISLMRAFSSSGALNFHLYDDKDPFCEHRKPKRGIALDLLFNRLLLIKDRLHTKTAKRIAEKRHKFLLNFVSELRDEFRY